MDIEGPTPRLIVFDDLITLDGGSEEDTREPRVAGSSHSACEPAGARPAEPSGVLSRGREVNSPTPLVRGGAASPTPTPRRRRPSVASDDVPRTPTPRVSANFSETTTDARVDRRHDAQWCGAVSTADAAREPPYYSGNDQPAARMNLGMGSQWRPTTMPRTEDVNLAMIQTLQMMAAQLEQLSARGPAEEPDFEFAGKATEDPVAFFNRFETWITEHRTPEERRHRVLRKCLRGEAAAWFAEVEDQEWGFIRTLFLQRFDAPASKGALWRELFGRYQSPNERVSPFVLEKWGLFKRLAPHMPEDEKVQAVHGLLLPRIRALTRGRAFENLRELMEQAALVEMDLLDEDKMREIRSWISNFSF